MLKDSRIPTPLVDESERQPVPLSAIEKPSIRRALHVFWNFGGLFVVWLGLVVTRQYDRARYGRRIRLALERMGGLWIKAGQVIALRIDIFPLEICQELSKLQSRALGFPEAVARRIVEEDLEGPLERYFDVWEPAPFAAASIGQVHRARLREEQVWVAVKVQKPYSKELFARDLTLIQWLVWLLALLRFWPHMLWDDALLELRQIMLEELDFGFEAASTRRMRKNLRRERVYVPKVFSRYSTGRVLVTEFLSVALMTDYIRLGQTDRPRLEAWLIANNVNPRLLARRMIWSFQRQLIEDNLFHGDMHPGNIGLLRDSRFALIDFGSTNFTEREYLARVTMLLRAIATDNFAKAADMSLMMCANLPVIDIELVREKLVRRIRAWGERTLVKDLPFHEKSMGNLTNEIMQVLLSSRCTMQWAWLRIHRASSTLDASLIELYPGIDYRKTTGRYFQKAEGRRAASIVEGAGARRSAATVRKSLDLPARTREYAMFQGTLVRRHVQVFRRASDRFGARVAWLLGVVRFGIVAQALLAIVLAGLGSGIPGLPESFGNRVPVLDPPLLVIVLLVDSRLWVVLSRLRNELRRPHLNLHHQPAATD